MASRKMLWQMSEAELILERQEVIKALKIPGLERCTREALCSHFSNLTRAIGARSVTASSDSPLESTRVH